MISENLERQSQRWAFRYLRWGGFGCVAGILAALLISLDSLHALENAWQPFPAALLALFSLLPTNVSFGFVLVLAITLSTLSFIEPMVAMKKIDRVIITEEDPKQIFKRFLQLRNALALYTFSMAALCAIYLILG